MHDRVRLANVGEELVAEPFALSGALNEAGDIDELDYRWHRPLWLDDLGQFVESAVRNFDHSDVRLDGAERVVGGFCLGSGQRVEKS